jgi:alpha-L-rhamnosidase
VRYRWSNPVVGDGLQVYQLRPVSAHTDEPDSFANLRSATRSPSAIGVTGIGSIRFDFGVESPAWLEFDSPDFSGTVELGVSEYNEPAIVNPGPAHPVKTAAPQRYGNTFRLELNAEYFEGVRFGWIHVRTFDQPWTITGVRVVCQAKPTNYNGSFTCSDPMLTRIWYTGAYVVRAGFQADYMAPILMDRGDRFGWAGDCNPIQSAALVAFGDWDYIKHNLDRTVDANFGIETYSLYWVLSLLEYFNHTGDTATLESYVANVRAKLDHGNDIYPDPQILFFGWDERLGAGFEAANVPETKAAYRMLLIRACREFADAAAAIGQDHVANTYRALADQRTAELRTDDQWFASLGVHALADAINAGCATQDEQPEIYAREFADRLNRLSYSTFNQYYILQAMAALGRHDEALVTARDNWGGQLQYGGTTFFEVFRPDWVRMLGKNDPVPNSQSGWTSLAHPWGGGITAWLSGEILGVKPTSPGFATIDIFPLPGRTIEWVSGSVPTPRGAVDIDFDVESGRGDVRIPHGSVARIGIPNAGREVKRVQVNGRVVWDGHFHTVSGVGGASVEHGAVVLTGVTEGRYELRVSYRGRGTSFSAAPLHYPMRFRGLDTKTSGDWGGVYGRDGHVLFNYDGAGAHRTVQPDYIQSVDPWESGYSGWSNCLNAVWTLSTTEARALAVDATNGAERAATCLYSGTPSPGGMTMALDVTATPGAKFQLAMYFLDWDSTTRRVSVEVFDLETRKLLAPVQLVNDFHEGAYLVYECDRSVRLRVAHVRGDNAVLSGLFFDPIVRR